MDMSETIVFAGEEADPLGLSSLPSLSSPLDALCAEHRKRRDDIERIAAYVAGETDVIGYFMDGAMVEGNGHSLTASRLFQAGHAIRSLDAHYWSRAIALTDVLDYMPQDKRQKWHDQIKKHETPPFEAETVKATLRELLLQRQALFAERIDGIFRSLSGEHITNSPAGFGKRMILSGITSVWGSTERVGYVNDLRCVIAKFMGRGDEPKWHASNGVVEDARRMHGQWLSIDGGALRIRCYLKGTAHLEVHPEVAYRLNAVLASIYPNAIPPEFRRKPTKAQKAPKDFVMTGRPLPFAVLELLASMKTGCRFIKQEKNWRNPYRREEVRNSMQFDNAYTMEQATEAAKKEAARVLSYIGGVKEPGTAGLWMFEYTPNEVIAEIIRTGCLPDQRTHQYYPTPESIAPELVALAEIEEGDTNLEPSAGQGGIADFLPVGQTTCVEISPLHCKVLESKGFATICADFLAWEPGRLFSKIVMNPPFSEGRAVAHVRKAATLLAPGPRSRIVAVLPAGQKGAEVVPGMVHEWGKTYAGEFEGTSVSVVTLVLRRS